MLRDDVLTGSFFLAFGLGAAMLSSQLDIGTAAAPGAGFVPFWASLLLAGFAATLLITSIAARPSPDVPEWRKLFHPRIAICVTAFVIYLVALPYLGFTIGSTALLYLLFGLLQPSPWYWRLTTALLTAVAFWFVFQKLLGLQLPNGRLMEMLHG